MRPKQHSSLGSSSLGGLELRYVGGGQAGVMINSTCLLVSKKRTVIARQTKENMNGERFVVDYLDIRGEAEDMDGSWGRQHLLGTLHAIPLLSFAYEFGDIIGD